MSTTPVVSVLMPVYNGERFISDAIDSVLAQTFEDFELIIIDDGSLDTTSNLLDLYNDQRIIRLSNEKNIGLVNTLNRGLDVANGEFVARLDADDCSLPDRFSRQLSVFRENPEMVLLGTAAKYIDENGISLGPFDVPVGDTTIRWRMLFLNGFVHSSVMFRMSTIRQYGLTYDEKMFLTEDYDLWSRLMNYGSVGNIEEALVEYRLHDGQITRLNDYGELDARFLVSERNLTNLGVIFSKDIIERLQAWLYGGEQTVVPNMEMFIGLLSLLSIFCKNNKHDKVITSEISQSVINRMFASIPVRAFCSGKLLKLFVLTVLKAPRACFCHVWMRVCNRVTLPRGG